jgi:hypothetical protein
MALVRPPNGFPLVIRNIVGYLRRSERRAAQDNNDFAVIELVVVGSCRILNRSDCLHERSVNDWVVKVVEGQVAAVAPAIIHRCV